MSLPIPKHASILRDFRLRVLNNLSKIFIIVVFLWFSPKASKCDLSASRAKILMEFGTETLLSDRNVSVQAKELIGKPKAAVFDMEIAIGCMQNCYPLSPFSDVKSPIVLEAICKKHCETVENLNYNWEINVPDFDYKKNTEFGQNIDIFYIKQNTLTEGNWYKISVYYKGAEIITSRRAYKKIHTHLGPQLTSCSINPTSGIALQTLFQVTCEYSSDGHLFEIYSVRDGMEFLLISGLNNNMLFLLNENAKVKVKLIDKYLFTDIKNVDVKVEKLSKKEDIAQFFDENSKNSLTALMNSDNQDRVLQILNAVVDDAMDMPKEDGEDVVKKYHMKMLDVLKNMPLDKKTTTRQAAALASRIASKYDMKSDPDLAKSTTELCEKAARKYMDDVKQETYPKMLSSEIGEGTKMLADCTKSSSSPNLEILKVEDTVVLTTTPFPVLEIAAITEDYPDYVDDQNTSKILSKFEAASNKLVDLCYVTAKTLAMSMIDKDETAAKGNDFFQITATRKFGQDIPNYKVISQKVDLFASEDFIRYKDRNVDVLLCTTTKNPFWWIQKEKITTAIAMVQFTVGDETVKTFDKPFSIKFENNEYNSSLLESYKATTPRETNVTVYYVDRDFQKITIFRIDVFRSQGYFIEFVDLATDDVLDVHVSDFVKPNPEEFRKNAIRIDESTNRFFIPHDYTYDSWHYLSVLPNEKMVAPKLEFKFKVYTLACFKWEASIRNWKFSCGVANTSSLNRFDCLCYDSAVLSGRIRNNKVKEERNLYVEHELELQASFTIFVSVAVVFFVYCFLLTLLSLMAPEKDARKNIYFLSDIPSYYRFGYLIIVKTGNKSNAGTTSNVVIKLYGKNSESKEHVLNFPDPEKKILQENQEDWFFLATKHHLGDIEKLEIWFDSLGLRPSWYCSEIEVVDLQKEKYWWFNIKFRFEIRDKENFFLAAEPENQSGVKKRRFSIKKLSMQGPHMWDIFLDEEVTFSRTKRLTIMLSIFMTTYTVILFLYGPPKLQNSDSLGQYSAYGLHDQSVWASFGGLMITFLIHLPIVHFFRYCGQENDVETIGVNRKGLAKYVSQINIICWCVLILLVVSSMTTLLVLGFWIPHMIGLLWLTSTVASLLIYIFLLENCLRLIYNFTLNRTKRVSQVIRQIKPLLAYIEAQRAAVFEKFGETALRPYYKQLYRPLQATKVKEQKHSAQIKEHFLEIVVDLIMISIYVTLLYMVILKDKEPMTKMGNEEALELVSGIHSRTKHEKHPISSKKDIEDYIANTIIFSLQSLQWYGRFLSEDPGLTIDNTNKYIGIVRLRQLRSKNVTCSLPSWMPFLDEYCISSFSSGPDYKDFSEGWGNDGESDTFARMDSVWNYKGYQRTGTLSYMGKFANYPGGGYVATLGRTLKNSLTNTKYIFRNNWIDRCTRCLFIEFLMYSPNSNLFHSVIVEYEISACGYIKSKYDVHTARLLFAKEENNTLLWTIMLSFVLVVIILIIKILLKIVKKKKMAFKDLWYIIDIVIITMSMACLFLYMERSLLVKHFLDKIEKARHNEFINYFHLFFAETTLTSLAAALIFLATLRLWKLLKFLKIIKITEKTFALSAAPLACAFFYHVMTIFIFTLIGTVFFGDYSKDFKDIRDSIMSLILIALCFFDFDFDVLQTFLHCLYYSMYMLVSLYFLTMYISIITMSYGEAQLFYSNDEGYNVFDYLWEQYQYYKWVLEMKLRHVSLRGGRDEDLDQEANPVYPKADEHRYAKCLTIPKNKSRAMFYLARAMLRSTKKKRQLTEEDEVLIKNIIVNLFRKDSEEDDYFFISNIQGHKAKLVDDLRFVKMEKILNILLARRDERTETMYKEILSDNIREFEKISENLSVMLSVLEKVEIDVDK